MSEHGRESWTRPRATNIEDERARLNHPTALKRRYDATHKVAEAKAVAAKPEKIAHGQEVERLKADIEMRDREIDWLKTKPAEASKPRQRRSPLALHICAPHRRKTRA